MTNQITFRIDGEPVAQGRPRFTKSGHAYDPARSREYKEMVADCAKYVMKGQEPIPKGMPVFCVIKAFYKIPKRFTKEQRRMAEKAVLLPTKKPDVDNLAKAIMDAMTGIVYEDDAQVVSLLCWKRYSRSPMVVVTVGTVKNE